MTYVPGTLRCDGCQRTVSAEVRPLFWITITPPVPFQPNLTDLHACSWYCVAVIGDVRQRVGESTSTTGRGPDGGQTVTVYSPAVPDPDTDETGAYR